MTLLPSPQWKFFFALTGLLLVAGTLWLPNALPNENTPSPLPTDQVASESNVSPLPTPSQGATAPSSGTGGGLVLLWVAVGVVLALGITLIFVLRNRRAA